jgi:hypothetical protein
MQIEIETQEATDLIDRLKNELKIILINKSMRVEAINGLNTILFETSKSKSLKKIIMSANTGLEIHYYLDRNGKTKLIGFLPPNKKQGYILWQA